jgi:hypothetical protein
LLINRDRSKGTSPGRNLITQFKKDRSLAQAFTCLDAFEKGIGRLADKVLQFGALWLLMVSTIFIGKKGLILA